MPTLFAIHNNMEANEEIFILYLGARVGTCPDFNRVFYQHSFKISECNTTRTQTLKYY